MKNINEALNKYLGEGTINEKSSLSGEGIPNNVITKIHKYYGVKATANWKEVKSKKAALSDVFFNSKLALAYELGSDDFNLISTSNDGKFWRAYKIEAGIAKEIAVQSKKDVERFFPAGVLYLTTKDYVGADAAFRKSQNKKYQDTTAKMDAFKEAMHEYVPVIARKLTERAQKAYEETLEKMKSKNVESVLRTGGYGFGGLDEAFTNAFYDVGDILNFRSKVMTAGKDGRWKEILVKIGIDTWTGYPDMDEITPAEAKRVAREWSLKVMNFTPKKRK